MVAKKKVSPKSQTKKVSPKKQARSNYKDVIKRAYKGALIGAGVATGVGLLGLAAYKIGSHVKKVKSRSMDAHDALQERNRCSNDLVCIYHVTHVNNLKNIMAHGLVNKITLQNNSIVYKRGDQGNVTTDIDHQEYPGVFTGIILKEDIGKKWPPPQVANISANLSNPSSYVTLIFSVVLLKQKNYHLNIVDNMGFIDKNTYTHKNISEFLSNVRKNEHASMYHYNAAEIIFHGNIPMNTLEEIWTNNKDIYTIYKEKYFKLKYVCKVPNKIYNKYCDLDYNTLKTKIDLVSEPNFCYYIGYYSGQTKQNTVKNLDKISKNCGQKVTVDNINKVIKEYFTKHTRIKPVYYPNFNWIL